VSGVVSGEAGGAVCAVAGTAKAIWRAARASARAVFSVIPR
jgi:hypothetical protein